MPFSEDVLQNLAVNENLLKYSQLQGIDIYRRCESLESHMVHILVISGFSRKKYCFSVLPFGLYLLQMIVKISTMKFKV